MNGVIRQLAIGLFVGQLGLTPVAFADEASITTLRRRASDLSVEVHPFVETTVPYMKGADLVICTGGYNTVLQALRHTKNVLVIPRIMHRREQLLRAETFQALGVVRTLTPDNLTPQSLRAQIIALLDDESQPLSIRERFAFDGATEVANFLRTHALLVRQAQETANE